MKRSCAVQGNVGAQPELRYTPNGKAVCSFNLATNADKDIDGNQLTTWIRVTCWASTAELVNRTVAKGDKIYCEGHLDEPWLFPQKDEKGKPVLDDDKHPVWAARNQFTAWKVTALEFVERPLQPEPVTT